jgi:hypothetical protein
VKIGIKRSYKVLKSYAAIYKQGHLEWLDDAPEQDNIQVIVTFIEIPKQVQQKPRVFGQHRGLCEMSADFNDELPDSFWFGH